MVLLYFYSGAPAAVTKKTQEAAGFSLGKNYISLILSRPEVVFMVTAQQLESSLFYWQLYHCFQRPTHPLLAS
jgi:hypothetical protein